jgi:hypothetical protein
MRTIFAVLGSIALLLLAECGAAYATPDWCRLNCVRRFKEPYCHRLELPWQCARDYHNCILRCTRIPLPR